MDEPVSLLPAGPNQKSVCHTVRRGNWAFYAKPEGTGKKGAVGMKRVYVGVLVMALLISGAAAELFAGGLLAQYQESYSRAAIETAQTAQAPEGLTLSDREYEIFQLGFAAGYEKYRLVASGLENPTYILNKHSKKFHDILCIGGKSIKPENREERQCDRQELLNEGYQPCQICNP